MEYTVADVVQALAELSDAKTAERAGRAARAGRPWGYHGNYLIDAVHKAEKVVEERLNAVIDARVAVAVRAINDPLVIAAEREACAKLCEQIDNPHGAIAGVHEALDCAAAIRERSDG